MNHNFREKLNEMRGENPAKPNQDDNPHYKTFDTAGHVRNLCFRWPDGKSMFLNYAYMIGGDYTPDPGRITLVFTSETIVLEGIRLNLLYNDLLHHTPSEITMIEQRYIATVGDNEFAVTSIEHVDLGK